MMRLWLHICCAPDATVALERLPQTEQLRLSFDNPNIQPVEEYDRRVEAFLKLIGNARVDYQLGEYNPDVWLQAVAGHEDDPEGGPRCKLCIGFRLQRAAQQALQNGFDTIGTVLTTSPHKKSEVIHELGKAAAEKVGLEYLHTDFKKQDGFKRSVELSRQMGLYRQNYCGCQYSIRRPNP
jgi:predicted adenine nucleotide alpha hydrolase (AANH) superfamily ATPase